MRKVDLNVDIGEGFPFDDALLDFATSANICCGEHAGSWELTERTVELCKRKGVRMGAHPGFPDRGGMGRHMPGPQQKMPFLQSVHKQTLRFVSSFLPAYVKPHGAWYSLMSAEQGTYDPKFYWIAMNRLRMLVNATQLPFMFLHTSRPARGLGFAGLRIIKEGFADRKYLSDGTLMPRNQPGAVLCEPEEIRSQVLTLAPHVNSICLHGDNVGCLEFAEMVRKTLQDASYEVGY